MSVAIRVESLSKRYRIGQLATHADELRHRWSSPLTAAFGRLFRPNRASDTPVSPDFVWALRDASFEMKAGEILGIIGRNGAGKSTLLKILSRITEPTSGRAEIRGRVAALLEVGTGFHRELTGRENVYLNGSILGMTKQEIDRKFDEIVEFSGVGMFIDTPVKRYSSGMHVRLGFAVAAHLQPEVLIVDEVLAVGDIEFQKKCLGKMQDVAGSGRTVLFVSHNMGAVRSLCPRSIWVQDGRVEFDGDSDVTVERYLMSFANSSKTSAVLTSVQGDFVIDQVSTRDRRGNATSVFRTGDPITVELQYFAKARVPAPYLWVYIANDQGPLFSANMMMDGVRPDAFVGSGRVRCTFYGIQLMPGHMYRIVVGGRASDAITTAIATTDVTIFRVSGTASDIGFHGDLAESIAGGGVPVLVPYSWELQGGRTVHVDPRREVPKEGDATAKVEGHLLP